MDPVSLTASIITLLSAASAVHGAASRLLALKDAESKLKGLEDELNYLCLSLAFVRRVTEACTDQFSEDQVVFISSAVQKVSTVVRSAGSFIDTKLSVHDATGRSIRRRGFVKKQRVDDLRNELRIGREHLVFTLTAATSIGFLQLHHRLPRLPLAVQTIHCASESSTLSLVQSAQQPPVPRPGSAMTIERVVEEPDFIAKDTDETTIRDPENGKFQAIPPSATRTCADSCLCCCHSRLMLRSPCCLRNAIGSVSYRRVGRIGSGGPTCDVPTCASANVITTFEYEPPRWLFPGTFYLRSSWDPLDGWRITANLHVPIYIPDNVLGLSNLIACPKTQTAQLGRFLVKNGLPPRESWPQDDNTILSCAIHSGPLEIFDLLLDQGADLSCIRYDGRTVVEFAWIYLMRRPHTQRRAALSRRLEAAGAFDQLNLNTCHEIAIGFRSTPLDVWINAYPQQVNSRDARGNTPLFWAARRGHIAMVRTLLARGADVHAQNNFGATALLFAISESSPHNKECVKALLDAGADVNAQRRHSEVALLTALSHAADIGDEDIVQTLLDHGAEVAPAGYPPLCQAAGKGHCGVVKQLLKANTEVDRTNGYGGSAITCAVQNNHTSCVRELCEKGARLNIIENDGDSIVDLAAKFASVEIMHILAQAKISGLDNSEDACKRYWKSFEEKRESHYLGPRHPIGEEQSGFRALLDSLQPGVSGSSSQQIVDQENGDGTDEEFFDAD